MATTFPPLPYPEFPRRPHRNGQWSKSIWSSRSTRSEQFYFGSSREDLAGEEGLNHPTMGWLTLLAGQEKFTSVQRLGSFHKHRYRIVDWKWS